MKGLKKPRMPKAGDNGGGMGKRTGRPKPASSQYSQNNMGGKKMKMK